MDVTAEEIARLCHEASLFSSSAGWTFKALPVMQWEFPTIGDFARARVQLIRAISPLMVAERNEAAWQRATSPSTFEIDCYGITFRLVCKQILATPARNFGAAQILYRDEPTKGE